MERAAGSGAGGGRGSLLVLTTANCSHLFTRVSWSATLWRRFSAAPVWQNHSIRRTSLRQSSEKSVGHHRIPKPGGCSIRSESEPKNVLRRAQRFVVHEVAGYNSVHHEILLVRVDSLRVCHRGRGTERPFPSLAVRGRALGGAPGVVSHRRRREGAMALRCRVSASFLLSAQRSIWGIADTYRSPRCAGSRASSLGLVCPRPGQ